MGILDSLKGLGLPGLGIGATVLGSLFSSGGGGPDYNRLQSLANLLMNDPQYKAASRAGVNFSGMMPGMLDSQLPSISPEVQAQLDSRYSTGARTLEEALSRESAKAYADLSSSMVAKGLGRGTPGMMGMAQINDSRLNALRTGLSELEQQRIGDYLGIRKNMMDTTTNRLGVYGGYLGGMADSRVNAFRNQLGVAQLQSNEAMQQDANLLGSLGEIGGAMPWLYWMNQQKKGN